MNYPQLQGTAPTARVFLSTSVVNDKIYAIGGGHAQKDTPFGVTEEYDPATDTWTKRADMPTARAGLTTAIVNGKIYAIGGAVSYNNFNLAFSEVEVYNPALDEWEKGLDMPTARAWISSSVANGKIYVIGGRTPAATLSVVEEYTPEDWQSISPQGKLPTKWGEVKSD